MTVVIVVALFLAAAAVTGSIVYGIDHHKQSVAKASSAPDDAVHTDRKSDVPLAASHVPVGHSVELGGVRITVRDVHCGKKLDAQTLHVWSRSESGLPCIVEVSATTGSSPVNLASGEQSLTDDRGHGYQVSSLQRLLNCDQIYDRELDPRARLDTGCLLYTLDKGRKPASLLMIHGPHSAVVQLDD